MAEYGGVCEEIGVSAETVGKLRGRFFEKECDLAEIKSGIWESIVPMCGLNDKNEFPTEMFYEFPAMWKLVYEVLRWGNNEGKLAGVLGLMGFRQASALP
jgi:hypothetical protein